MILGITGTDGAGKGTVVDYLVLSLGFVHCSARAIWNEELQKRGMESTRANMRLVANELRAQYGNDFLVTYYQHKIEVEKLGNVIIDSIRATAEVDTLKKNGGLLLSVDAESTLRYQRIQSRAFSSDKISFEQFLEQEKIEMNDPNPHGMQKAKVMEMADYTIFNNGTLEELHSQIEAFLKTIVE